ncbi:unconventional myosin-XIX-like [Antedon mediterranea]|uniref:unconventional myosin-XIX-like n=1 Tax=Antedon mediterranea TaxID=105859 RepID=UPI003AF9240D
MASDGKIIITKSNDQEVVIRGHAGYPVLCTQTDWINTDDLVLINPLSEPAVLNCLRERYLAGRYHTQTGNTLVTLNPFKETGHFDVHMIHRYHSDQKAHPPHIFGIAETALCNLTRRLDKINQSIIVSGESGSGKTWNARCLLKYLTMVAVCNPGGFTPSPADCIERRILDSNPILEAFGNASTTRNHNSSRFGKYIQIQFSRGNHVVGASIQTYLLEKTRVVYQCDGARNFHIFYQMLFGGNERERRNWLLPNSDNLNYVPLNRSEDACNQKDKHDFIVTKQAMCNVGLSKSQQQELFKVLSVILHLGNVDFISDDVTGPCEIDSEKQGVDTSVNAAAQLLGLDVDALTRCLAFRQITASHKRRKSVFMKPCIKDECHTRRDCLAKLLYARVFDWLVGFINDSTMARSCQSYIGLLDVYGFESFSFNSLEQLCINYANEKLQQHFVHNFLKAEQDDCQSEGIPWKFEDFTDNKTCLDVIEGNISIFALMNQQCKLNRHSDPSSFCEFLLDTISSASLSRAHISVTSPAFVVHHYAEKVTYQVDGLIEKNKDGIPAELVDLLKISSKKFVQQLVEANVTSLQSSSKTKGKKTTTVVSKFKNSLDSLMATLHETTPHYIRCIQPSLECQPDSFDNVHVINQLRACGVLETIEISATGFPTRMLYSDFLKRYELLIRSNSEDVKDLDTKSKCAVITNLVLAEADKENKMKSFLFGKTKIFLREGQLDKLEVARLKEFNLSSGVIQIWWRKILATKSKQEAAVVIIQAGFRGWKVREDVKRRHEAARVIQYAMIGYSIRLHQRKLDEQLNELNSDEVGLYLKLAIYNLRCTNKLYNVKYVPSSLTHPHLHFADSDVQECNDEQSQQNNSILTEGILSAVSLDNEPHDSNLSVISSSNGTKEVEDQDKRDKFTSKGIEDQDKRDKFTSKDSKEVEDKTDKFTSKDTKEVEDQDKRDKFSDKSVNEIEEPENVNNNRIQFHENGNLNCNSGRSEGNTIVNIEQKKDGDEISQKKSSNEQCGRPTHTPMASEHQNGRRVEEEPVNQGTTTIINKFVQVATTPAVDIAFGIALLGLLYHGPVRL